MSHHLRHCLVRLQITEAVPLNVSFICSGFEGGQQITGMNNEGGTTNLAETERGHDAGTDSISVDRLRGEHKIGVLAELGVDVVAVAIPGDDTGVDRLQETDHLPSGRSILGVTNKTLLSDDRDSVSRCARYLCEDVVPYMGFIAFVGAGTCSMDRQNTKVVWSVAPDSEGTTEWGDSRVRTF